MDSLPFAPAHRAGEPPPAYASRLAAAYGLEAKEFCGDHGIRRLDLVNGSQEAIAELAALGGVDAGDLTRHAFVRTGTHEFRYRDQTVRREYLTDGRLDVCPRCLAEDIEGAPRRQSDTAFFCRAEWCLDVVDTCPTHRTALVTFHEARGLALGFDFSNLLASETGQFAEMAGRVETRAPTALQDYVLARLDGRETGVVFLDAMDLSAAIRTCEMLGAAACFGRTVQCDDLDAIRLRTARIRGFEIGSRGRSGIEELLKMMTTAYTRSRQERDGQITRLAFAALHNYLFVDPNRPTWKAPAFVPLRAAIRDFIKTNFPLKPGEVVLGETITERRLHSVTSLARDVGFGAERVKKLLRLNGVIDDDQARLADYNIVVDAKAGLDALRDSLTALPYHGVAKYLGIPPKQAVLLVEAKLIEPIASSPLGLRATFAPAMLDAFVAKLLRGAQTVKRKASHHFTIREAALRSACRQDEVAKLILDGRLKWVGILYGKQRYSSILVDLAEVDIAVNGLAPDTISIAEFAKRIGLKKEAGLALVKHGHVDVSSCERAGHQVSRISVREVEAFQHRYVSLGELGRIRRKHSLTIKKTLDEKGILPAFDLGKVRVQFYRREQIT
jgi:hypothetical protein